MIKFSYVVPADENAYTATTSIEVSINSQSSIYDIIESFGEFMQACGFCIDGRIDLVSEGEVESEDAVMMQAMAEYYFNLFEKEDKASQPEQPEKGTGR